MEQLLREDTENPTKLFSDNSLKLANSILTFFFSLKQLSKVNVKSALIWVRCLMLTGSVKKLMRQENKAKQYYERAFEMITELEETSDIPDIGNDEFEPIGRYKLDLTQILFPKPQKYGNGNEDSSAITIKRQNSLGSVPNPPGGSPNGGLGIKRQSRNSMRSSTGSASSDKKGCVVM